MNKFKLSIRFLEQYINKQPDWGYGDLSYFVYKRTYARTKEDGSQEEFFDTCKRVVEGCFQIQLDHCTSLGLPWDAYRAQRSAQKMFEKIWEFKFTPPGRGLWIMGTPITSKLGSTALQNCGFISTKNIKRNLAEPFAWACDMLMLGVGVGFDTKGADLVIIKGPKGDPIQYVIPDTREGWVESIRLLIESYTGKNRVDFDYSKIRKGGEPIKGFGGTSSGPKPLEDGHKNIRALLDSMIGEPLSSTAITDIMNYIGKFVVAGNVRRSAELAIGSIDDKDFIQMKDPKKFKKELADRRWASNNSVEATTDSTFSHITPSIVKNGEPGLIFLENSRHYGRLKDGYNEEGSPKYDAADGYNPCAEQSLAHGEMCCLVETFPARHDSPEEYYETLKYAYLYAKTVTLLPTHDPLANSVMLQNRRIGLSQSGIQQAIKKFGHSDYFKKFCDQAYVQVQQWDRVYSRWLGVPSSLKTTTVKPSGTVSLLAGATPGVHCTHSEYYLRTVRIAASSPLVRPLLKAGYKIEIAHTDNVPASEILLDIPGSRWGGIIPLSELNSKQLGKLLLSTVTLVVYFPVKEKNYTKSKYEITIWEQMLLVRELQTLWSDNAVSNTVTVRKGDEKDLESAIRFFAPYVKTLSFLPLEDHNYNQAPYITITQEEYENYSAGLKKLNFSKVENVEITGEKFCDSTSCTVG
jgi:adenosylcobalamin-dependent ribonucleoside-triphosphate reductase